MDDAIKKFLSERKDERIKKKVKASMTEEEKLAVEQEAKDEFSLDSWLPNAAKRAGQLSLVSHPGKFSHPSSKTSSIIASAQKKPDGFLRTGNDSGELDVFGNAAALDVYKFLSIELKDGKSVLEHIEQGSGTIRKELKTKTASYEEIQQGFMKIKQRDNAPTTSGKVKQVYFPVNGEYHLLSILTPSGLMFKLRNKIQDIRFSEQVKEARLARRKQDFNENGFAEILNLSVVGFGGTKPQNISVLNSKYGGKSYLLRSMPPILEKRKIKLPKNNFFINSLWIKAFADSFKSLHKLIAIDYNNIKIRDARDNIIQYIIDQVIEKMWAIRRYEGRWSAADNYARLPAYQKIWLDNVRKEERETNDEWLDKVISELARWFILAYKKVLGKKAKLLADDELAHIRKFIAQNKEGFR